jgi:hypothetical protein
MVHCPSSVGSRLNSTELLVSTSIDNGRNHFLCITLLHPILTTKKPTRLMSSRKPATFKPESRNKKAGRGLWGLFGKKKGSRILSSNSSQSLDSSEAGSIQKHGHKPSITIEETTLPVVEVADVGASSNPQALLQAPDAQSRRSLASHRSKGSLNSNHASPHNE